MLICGIAKELSGVVGSFGGWMEQAFQEINQNDEVDLVIITSGNYKELIKKDIQGVTYYVLPCGDPFGKFRADDKKAQLFLRTIIDCEKPDIIHIWGTESELGLALCRIASGIPKVVYMQGIMKSVEQHYYESTKMETLRRNLTIYDLIKGRTVRKKNIELKKKALNEAEVLRLSGHIITDNDWCIAMCRSMNPDLKVHRQNLTIDSVFNSVCWENNDNHILFCASQYAPFKGFETLLRALKTVKKVYPDVCIEVPSGWQSHPHSIKEWLIYNTYSKTINNLISELDLHDNIKKLGRLSREQMAEHMRNAEVFVQCSTVESHSSTMREALNVGVPCIVSDVGSTPEYVLHNKTGLLYRSNEVDVLAYYIMLLFNESDLRSRLGKSGHDHIQNLYSSMESLSTITIYKDVIEND